MKRLLALALGSLLALGAVARAQTADTSYLDRKIELAHKDAALRAVLDDLAARAGIVVACPDAIASRKVTADLESVAWREALEKIARDNGLRIVGAPGGVQVEPRPAPATVTLAGSGLELRQAIADIVRAGPMSVVVAPDVKGTVDVALGAVPWPKALLTVLGAKQLRALVKGDVLLVTARAAAAGEVVLGEEEPALPVRWPLRAGPAASPAAADAKASQAIDCGVVDASLEAVMDEVGRRVGRNILVEPAAVGTITLTVTGRPWRQAVDILAASVGCYVHEASGVLLVRKPALVTAHAGGKVSLVLALIAGTAGRNLVLGELPGEVLVDLRGVEASHAIAVVAEACRLHVTRLGELGEVTVVTAHPPRMAVAPSVGDSIIDGLDKLGAPGKEIDVAVEADLRDVIAAVAARVDKNMVVEPEIQEKLSVSLRKLPWQRALLLLARLRHSDVSRLPGGIPVVEQPAKVTIQFSDANVRTVLQLLAAYSGKNIIVAPDVRGDVSLGIHEVHWLVALRAFALAFDLELSEVLPGVLVASKEKIEADFAAQPRWRAKADSDETIDLSLEETDLVAAVARISKVAGVPIAVAPNVKEKVTVHLAKVEWHDALEILARFSRCEIKRTSADQILVDQPPKITVQATDVPAKAWFELLGQHLGEEVHVAKDAKAELTFDLHELTFDAVLHATAIAYGMKSVRREGGGREVRVAANARAIARSAPRPAPTAQPAPKKPRPVRDPKAEKELEDGAAKLIDELGAVKSAEDFMKIDFKTFLAQPGGADALEPKLFKWIKKNPDLHEIGLALKLMLWIEKGNGYLRGMLHAKQTERYEDVPGLHESVKDLVADMKSEEREEFHRNADALTVRAKALADEAKVLKKIRDGLPMDVRAIVVDPTPGAKNHAVVVLADGAARIVAEGDKLGTDGMAAATSVVKVSEGSIQLRWGDTLFVKELAAPE